MSEPAPALAYPDERRNLDPAAWEAAAWDEYMTLTARWEVGLDRANGQTTEIGMLLNQLGSSLQGEPDLGWHFAELVRGFVTFNDRLATISEQFEERIKVAEREWRRALDTVAEPDRTTLEARRLAERARRAEAFDDLDDE